VPWTCPACRTAIQHSEDLPRPSVVYRCHICRLELVSDPSTGKLIVAPMSNEQSTRVNSNKQKATR
jgi:hypothetical protein